MAFGLHPAALPPRPANFGSFLFLSRLASRMQQRARPGPSTERELPQRRWPTAKPAFLCRSKATRLTREH